MSNDMLFSSGQTYIKYSVDTDRFLSNNVSDAISLISTPLTLCFHIGYRCNLTCNYCLSPYETDESRRVDYKYFIHLIKSLNIKRVVISGGEPFMYPLQLHSILTRLKEIGCYTIVSTNGILVEKNLNLFIGLVDWFDISLPGTNRETYRQMRTGDYFDTVYHSIDTLISNNQRVRLSYTISETNLEDAMCLPKLVKKLCVRNVRLGHLYSHSDGHICNELDYTSVIDLFKQMDNMTLYFPLTPTELKEYEAGYLVSQYNGNLFICNVFPENYLGNVVTDTDYALKKKLTPLALHQAKLFLTQVR